MFTNKMLASALICTFLLPIAATAGSKTGGKIAVGFQSSWPSYGLSAKYDYSEDITLQGTVGAFGTVTNFGAKALYKFKKEPQYDLYGFVSAGVYKYSGAFFDESVVGFGGGAGIEYDLSKLLEGMPLTISGEVGMSVVNFDNYTGFSAFGLGVGLHYWF